MSDYICQITRGATAEQKDIILSAGGILVNACPGSGKTWTVSRLFVNRVREKSDIKRGVALLSYTNVAISEFRKFISDFECDIGNTGVNYVGTLDSFVDRFIIMPYFYLLGVDDCPTCCGYSFSRSSRLNNDLRSYENALSGIERMEFCCGRMEFVTKNNYRYTSDDVLAKTRDILLTTKSYTHSMRRIMALLILQNVAVRRCLSSRFVEIIMDEAQDTNILTLCMLDLLKEVANQSFFISLIGDERQTIYEFSGASIKYYKSYADKWLLHELPLSRSFRFTNNVARDICALFGQNYSHESEQEGYGIYLLNKTDFTGENVRCILKEFEVSEKDALLLMRGKVPYKIPLIIKELMDVCRERDELLNIQSAYYNLVSLIKEHSLEESGAIQYGAVIPELWRLVRNREYIPSMNMPLSEWYKRISHGFEYIFQTMNIKIETDDAVDFVQRNGRCLVQELNVLRPQSIHSAKGCTCDGVFIIGDGKYWADVERYIKETKLNWNGNQASELRTIYVAMTRARKFVVLVRTDRAWNAQDAFWGNNLPKLCFDSSGEFKICKIGSE